MTEARISLLLQMSVVAVLSVLVVSHVGSSIVESDSEAPSRTDQIINDRLNGGVLEVKPASGQPVPLDQPLQSTRNQASQEAQGELQQSQENLQQPSSQDRLQPSVTSDDLPDDFQL